MTFGISGAALAGAAVSIGGAVAGSAVSSAMSGGGGASGAAGAADPFAGQRGQYQTMLSNLINNPSSITSTPGYQFGLDQSNKAVEGSAAANGMVNSGNVLQALSTNSQSYASQQLNNQELLLAQLAGANIGSPGTAGQILAGQNTANQQAGAAVGNAVGGAITQGINGFNSGSGYPGGDPFATDTSGYGAGANTYGFSSGVNDPSSGVSYGFGA
jgi:hypothetical protein